MARVLWSIAVFSRRFRWWVLAGWLILLVGMGSASTLLGGQLVNTFAIPGTQSQQALDQLQARFPQAGGGSVTVVYSTNTTDASGITAHKAGIQEAAKTLLKVTDVTDVASPFSAGGSGQIAKDGDIAYTTVALSVQSDAVTPQLSSEIQAAAQVDGVSVAFSGLPAPAAGGIDFTELAGLAVALIVLMLTFGSLLAAGLPLISAVSGVTLTGAAILTVGAFASVPATAPLLASMLGLAVGIDYSLFILARFRAECLAGTDRATALSTAVATAGTAVVFAGGTVLIALLGLAVVQIPFLTVMGVGAAVAVLVAVLASITLLPALVSVLGRWAVPRKVRKAAKAGAPAPAADPAKARRRLRERWGHLLTTKPLVVALVGTAAMLGLAVPVTGLALTLPDAGYDPPGTTARVAYDQLADGFGPGRNGPLLVMAELDGTLDFESALKVLPEAFTHLPGVAAVSKAVPNEGLDLAIVSVTPTTAPTADATAQLVSELRGLEPRFRAEHGFGYQVTGQTAMAIDISDRLEGALVPFGAVVLGLCIILLTIVFRSIAVPLVAAAGFVLSLLAALGATALVFENGVLAEVLGVAKVGPVISFMPVLVIAVLFGLAMDYQVFLTSRMREAWDKGVGAREAVREGFVVSAPVVTAAAIIMTGVFVSFVPGGSAIIQPIAFGLAVGVLVDAFVVRMAVVPAVLALLGPKAWALPAFLERILPHVDIEGTAVLAGNAGSPGARAVRAPRRGRAVWTWALVLALLAPLVAVAGAALPAAAATALPLRAAIVNLDTPVEETLDGQKVPVIAGKLLTTQLAQHSTAGVEWVVTGEREAKAGLVNGHYALAVIIPSDFSKGYATVLSGKPARPTLEVHSSGRQSQAMRDLASALGSQVPQALTRDMTSLFVTASLDGFTAIGKALGDAGTIVGELATAEDDIAEAIGDVGDVSDALGDGLGVITDGLGELDVETAELGEGLAGVAALVEGADLATDGVLLVLVDLEADLALLDLEQGLLKDGLDSLINTPTALSASEATAIFEDIRRSLHGQRDIRKDIATNLEALGVAALTVAEAGGDAEGLLVQQVERVVGLAEGITLAAGATDVLDTALQDLGAGLDDFDTGVGKVGSGIGELSTALDDASDAFPAFTKAEVSRLSEAISRPILVKDVEVATIPGTTALLATVLLVLAWSLMLVALLLVFIGHRMAARPRLE